MFYLETGGATMDNGQKHTNATTKSYWEIWFPEKCIIFTNFKNPVLFPDALIDEGPGKVEQEAKASNRFLYYRLRMNRVQNGPPEQGLPPIMFPPRPGRSKIPTVVQWPLIEPGAPRPGRRSMVTRPRLRTNVRFTRDTSKAHLWRVHFHHGVDAVERITQS